MCEILSYRQILFAFECELLGSGMQSSSRSSMTTGIPTCVRRATSCQEPMKRGLNVLGSIWKHDDGLLGSLIRCVHRSRCQGLLGWHEFKQPCLVAVQAPCSCLLWSTCCTFLLRILPGWIQMLLCSVLDSPCDQLQPPGLVRMLL